jgi:hypothetical protein
VTSKSGVKNYKNYSADRFTLCLRITKANAPRQNSRTKQLRKKSKDSTNGKNTDDDDSKDQVSIYF